MQQRITRIQTEQANEIARLIKQYITIDQRMKGVPMPAAPQQQVNKIMISFFYPDGKTLLWKWP